MCLAALLTGCASTGTITGRVSAPETARSAPADGDHAPGQVSARGSVADAVIYVQDVSSEVESELPAPREPPRFEIANLTFHPRVLAVVAGTSVEFQNRDSVFHNVFSICPANRFDLGRYGPGKSRRAAFRTPGPVNIYCDLHPKMSAFILVVPNRAFARADSVGRFVLPPLPPGQYGVVVWHPDFPPMRRTITVSGGKCAEMEVTLAP